MSGLQYGLVRDLFIVHGGQLASQGLEAFLEMSAPILLQFVVHLAGWGAPGTAGN